MGETKPSKITETKLKRVAQLSSENPSKEFMWLMPHVNKETLIGCFNELDGEKAVGIDRVTKEEWDGFNEFMKHFPPPKVIVRHRMY